ncbi:hypothetical protein [Paenibacillus sp. MZ03-122A]|uniref:hypothetical protein n=1 Tax=Paenibacillus sp. MZ03-122A TaxID=2962033 RepID=UPI000FB714BA|nr:hypothetical protein [Paenibacillus sp. MZ03-122A]MCP3781571.1 hypothetical protein [Paenibacillus sp. MZ03-122A]
MLYSRLLLAGHEQGLVVQPVRQVLEEYPEMQEAYTWIHQEHVPSVGTIQFLIRMVQPMQDTPLSIRREATALIID